MRKYSERVSIVLPKPMKAALLELLSRDGRRLGEYLRSLISRAIADDKKDTRHP